MFRFFCTTCKSVKRVQHIPKIIENQSLGNPTDRIGQCDSHFLVKQVRTIKTNKVIVPTIEPSKKGRKR